MIMDGDDRWHDGKTPRGSANVNIDLSCILTNLKYKENMMDFSNWVLCKKLDKQNISARRS